MYVLFVLKNVALYKIKNNELIQFSDCLFIFLNKQVSRIIAMIEEPRIERPTETPKNTHKGRHRKEKPVEPAVKKHQGKTNH